MAAGGPGDHWGTDLLIHGRAAFGEPSDSLIKEIYEMGGRSLLDDEATLGRLLWELWPQWGRVDETALRELADELKQVRDDLRQQRVDRADID